MLFTVSHQTRPETMKLADSIYNTRMSNTYELHNAFGGLKSSRFGIEALVYFSGHMEGDIKKIKHTISRYLEQNPWRDGGRMRDILCMIRVRKGWRNMGNSEPLAVIRVDCFKHYAIFRT